jgi:hypothetical protein
MQEAAARPQDLVSRGLISDGYSHPRGPQDQAYAMSNRQVKPRMYHASQEPLVAGMNLRDRAMTMRAANIWNPACKKSGLLPNLSAVQKDTYVDKWLQAPRMMAATRLIVELTPRARKICGA